MSSRKSEPAILSFARINRLLRPLRSRCISLAKSSSPQVRRTTIYSCRGESSKEPFIPSPLSLLPQPSNLGSRQYIDSHQAEMARRIYAVRDCFQDIVINTRRHVSEENLCRVQSLAALCSTVAGDNMEYQVINDDDDGAREGEVESSKLMSDLYDAIPGVYRRCALLSQAIRIVLMHCSDNATLLTRLLDVTLEHKLDFESSLLLYRIMSLSLSSPADTSNIPFICRPLHTNFFLDLYTQWNSNGSPDTTFFRILFSALELSQDERVWSTSALHNIAQIMYVQDFASYLRLISIYSTFAAEPCTASEFEARKSLLSRISTWLETILEHFPFTTVEHDPDRGMKAYSNDVGEMLTCVLSSICSPKASQVFEGLEADIQAIIVSLSIQWLTVQPLPLQSLVEKLSVTLPHVSTFTPLVAKVFLDSNGCLRVLRAAIQDIACTLYSLSLLHLHASLLGCTLRYIENSSHERELEIKNGVQEVQKYRHELIKLADEAEDRFVGPHEFSVSKSGLSERSHTIATPLRRELFRDISEWEPNSGSWVRKLEYGTSVKKRKVVHGQYVIASEQDSRNTALTPDNGNINSRVTRGHGFLFSTLLSRAASKRVILHPIIPSELGEADQESRDMSDDGCEPVSFSDDALDLFTWPPTV